MRVVAGVLGGRQFNAPKGHRTHPMSEKARGGMFNALGDIDELTFLDAFAGSGALGFEALSRGAKSVLAIDVDPGAVRTIKENIDALGLQKKIKAVRANASGWSDNNPKELFDVVIAAPPYDDLQAPLVQKMFHHTKPGGLFIIDWPPTPELPEIADSEFLVRKDYGDATLSFYRRHE